uniref:Uncharacterized protein n=1 Tax=Timema shepardi TaxID=629360 RepID=A0A7R9AU14_TIMSH|nr:unnamed protein product [Timema shepardi]
MNCEQSYKCKFNFNKYYMMQLSEIMYHSEDDGADEPEEHPAMTKQVVVPGVDVETNVRRKKRTVIQSTLSVVLPTTTDAFTVIDTAHRTMLIITLITTWQEQQKEEIKLKLWAQDSAVGQRGLKQRQGKANNLQAESNKSKPQDVSSKPKVASRTPHAASHHTSTTSNKP